MEPNNPIQVYRLFSVIGFVYCRYIVLSEAILFWQDFSAHFTTNPQMDTEQFSAHFTPTPQMDTEQLLLSATLPMAMISLLMSLVCVVATVVTTSQLWFKLGERTAVAKIGILLMMDVVHIMLYMFIITYTEVYSDIH